MDETAGAFDEGNAPEIERLLQQGALHHAQRLQRLGSSGEQDHRHEFGHAIEACIGRSGGGDQQ